ncbi:F0F1 ATP synthase subunit A [Mycoplasmopsis caviae]|uniref:F0F1 ATP synthase subunit A n=1 Tax=Mycoplasmopsis caviae TaxID=55603 RepID=A0A3P8MFA7_9BACT|nr:F0F1 ATP synthase subunit A [Mycoplasmopsis caviae]UUD35010.1 F0F1 ATP synthase subunit A [Mycoplasmopsis caviae]VDR42163.1 F0F1 ATP synthase subunit A [Mycoplasmopsis caviae]
MNTLTQNLWKWNMEQMFSLFVLVILIFIVSLTTFILIKKTAQPNKAPIGFLIVMEGYVNFLDSSFDENTEGALPKAKFYIFALFTFLLLGNLLGLFGLKPIATNYSITFSLAFISFAGIYVVGLLYQKFRFFSRFLSPIEVVGQFAPLISLGFRIFGNITGGGVIVFLTYIFTGWIWTKIPGLPGEWFFIGSLITPLLHMYFDMFGAIIQALVFCTLTTVYWSKEAETNEEKRIKEAQEKSEADQAVANVEIKAAAWSHSNNVY